MPPCCGRAFLWLRLVQLWQDIHIAVDKQHPDRDQNGQLILPATPSALEACNGVELKPLRNWVGDHFSVRLQAAPGLVFFLWPQLAMVVFFAQLPLHGFLHGPTKGQRHVLAIAPAGDMRIPFRQ